MSLQRSLPYWLIQATETASYIDEAWTILTLREQQRAIARSTSRSRRDRRATGQDPSRFDPALLNRYSVSIALSPTNRLFNRYLDVVPYDRNRVIPPGLEQRYLNAR
jgi:protein tyrosine phosphatase